MVSYNHIMLSFTLFPLKDDPDAKTQPQLQRAAQDLDNTLTQAILALQDEEEAITRRFEIERKRVNDNFLVSNPSF